MPHAVISAYMRSPFTPASKGALAVVRPDEMAGQVIRALISKSGVKAEHIEDVLVGCAFPEGEQGFNVARLISFLAGVPKSAAGATINRFCGSSMDSVHRAVGAIACGAGDVFICAGVESMTRIPMGGFNPMPHPRLYTEYPEAFIGMGLTAENLAKQYGIKRKAQEEFALASHKKAAEAQAQGRFADEIVPIATGKEESAQGDGHFVKLDGCVRAETTLEKLATLEPAFDKKGSVTAGTSSPLTDGASAVLVVSEDYANQHGLPKLARVKSIAVSGCAPEIMGIGPVGSTRKALERAGLQLGQMDVIELNEAFAAQSMAVIQELGIDTSKLNLDGGAIALGHPLGASGARITGKAAQLLKRTGGNYALATMCIGGGQGIATVLERA